jgi:hypothetical protein
MLSALPKGHAELADQLLPHSRSFAILPRETSDTRGVELLEGIVAILTKMT